MLRRFAVWLVLLVCASIARGQAIYPPINSPVFRALDANGAPLAGGKLYTYAAGSSTLLATYADAGGVSPNANPVILDSAGRAKIFLGPASYKFVLQDANGVQQWTVDNISGAPAPSAVTSVFGRTGDVVAVTGDYTCSQITGAVCALPTLRYQTVQVTGAAQPQRSALNLLSGTGITITCADNAGADSTDCTVTYSGSTGTSRVCATPYTDGCYLKLPDGTIFAWGVKTSASTGATVQTQAITFPSGAGFTVTPTIQVSGGGQPDGNDDNYAVFHKNDSITGTTAVVRCAVNIGGSGCSSLNAVPLHWTAIGY